MSPTRTVRAAIVTTCLVACVFIARATTLAQGNPGMSLQVVKLSGAYTDLPQAAGLDPVALIMGGGVKQKSFYRLCEYLDQLRDDAGVSHVLFDLSDPVLAIDLTLLEELDRKLIELKDSGKTLYAWLENAGSAHYSVASVCDKVFMADLAMLDLPSLGMSSMHFKDAMDFIGVEASVARCGDFKGAVEPYTEPRMSDHLKKHYLEMLRTMNDSVVARVASHRGMSAEAIRSARGGTAPLEQQRAGGGAGRRGRTIRIDESYHPGRGGQRS